MYGDRVVVSMNLDKNYSSVDFANFNYAYFEFQLQYKLLCESITEMKRDSFSKIKNNPLKKVSAMIKEYRVFIRNIDMRKTIDKDLLKLEEDIENNIDYNSMCNTTGKSLKLQRQYNKYYYTYLIRLFEIVGKFGDELSSTFMPTKGDRKKLFKYQNTNTFFEQFTKYKSAACNSLAELSIIEFRKNFAFFLGFYYAYYSYIDAHSRNLCERALSKVMNIYLSEKLSTIIANKKNRSKEDKITLREYDKLFHKTLTIIFSRMNISYSNYGITPKIEEKIKFDHTMI